MACKSAETREQRARSDLKRASHGEDLFTVAETRIGEKPKFKLSEARLLTIVGGWVGDDVTQLGEGSIYRRLRRWPGIWMTMRGGRKGAGRF